jgi:hypothetical protein
MKAYHSTHRDNVKSILENGLIGGKVKGFIDAGEWADRHYGCRPVYVSLDGISKSYHKETHILLEIDITGLEQLPDLPTLVDWGMYVEGEVNPTLWFDQEKGFPGFTDEGFDVKSLFDYYCKKAIRLTETCAIREVITPNRVKILEEVENR